MGLVETEGLVLKNYSLSDADKIVVVLTRDRGLVRGVAKGAKRLKSHYGSSLEPFSLVRFSYFQKEQQELVSIRGVELTRSLFEKASDPAVLQRFAYMAELVGEFAPPGEPNERLFNMTTLCLRTCAEQPSASETVLAYFELWLLKLCGYLPSWEACEECGQPFGESDPATLQGGFRLICSACQQPGVKSPIGKIERIVYASAQKMGPDKFIDLCSDKAEAVGNVSGVLKRIISGVLGRDWQEDRILSAIYK